MPRPFNGTAPQGRRSYDITPDGKFVGLVPAGFADSGAAAARVIEVVVNWAEELKQRVPVK